MVGTGYRIKRVAIFTMLLFVSAQLLGQYLMDRWPMHPAYKNLPAWVVDEVWRPLVWKGNKER